MPFCASRIDTTSAASTRLTPRSEPCNPSRKSSTFAVDLPSSRPGMPRVCCSRSVVRNMEPSASPFAFVSGRSVRALSLSHQGFLVGSSDICGVSASSEGTRTGAACDGRPCATGVPRSDVTTTKGSGRVVAKRACR